MSDPELRMEKPLGAAFENIQLRRKRGSPMEVSTGKVTTFLYKV
jgi:hypothetical protein